MEKIDHRTVTVNGINMHIAEIKPSEPNPKPKGTILFLHGFPELWYTWRHQLFSLSSAGYHAVAPDLRGYGDTDAPPSATSYTSFHVIGDLVALLDLLSVDQVFLVGHDWGAMIAWNFCLLRADRVQALVNLSVPFSPRNPKMKPVQGLRHAFGDDFYICRFQDDQIEEEFAEMNIEGFFKQVLTMRDPKPPIRPKGQLSGSTDKPITLPSWLSEDDIKFYVDKFKQTGFTGGLNYYRAMDLTWELMAPWTGAQIKVPVKFIMGDLDLTYNFPNIKDYIHKGGFRKDVPFLEDVIIMEGVGHFINQEKPKEISKHIQEFFDRH